MQRHLVAGLLVSAGLLASAAAVAQSGSTGSGEPDPAGIIILGTSADLSVTIKGAPTGEAGDRSLTYMVVVANTGPSPAASATLTNDVPAHTTFASLDAPAGWRCATPRAGDTGSVTCSRALVPVGDSARFTLVVTVDADRHATEIVNVATVSAPTSDPLRGNNSATVAITTPVSLQAFGVD